MTRSRHLAAARPDVLPDLTNKKWSSTAILVYPALMPAFICTACGTQYPPSEAPPGACLICTDERQFVPASGQSWTTLEGLRNAHSNKFRRLATGLMRRFYCRMYEKMPAASPWHQLVLQGGGQYRSPGYFDSKDRLVAVHSLRD